MWLFIRELFYAGHGVHAALSLHCLFVVVQIGRGSVVVPALVKKHVVPKCHTMPPERGLVSLRGGENDAILCKTQKVGRQRYAHSPRGPRPLSDRI